MCDTPIFIYRDIFFSTVFSLFGCILLYFFHCSCVSSFVPVVLFVWLFIVCSPILCRAIFVRFSFYWNKYKDLLYTRCLAICLCSHCRLFHTFCNVWYLLLVFFLFFVFYFFSLVIKLLLAVSFLMWPIVMLAFSPIRPIIFQQQCFRRHRQCCCCFCFFPDDPLILSDSWLYLFAFSIRFFLGYFVSMRFM